MIPPQELRNKTFSRSGKGYDSAEVDEYLDFIIEQYSNIFAQCDKYDKKLRIVSSRINEIQSEEETIRKLAVSTQRNCDRLLSEAEEEAKNTILGAHQEAEGIIANAREKASAALASIERKANMLIDATQEKSDALLLSARTRCTRLLSDFKKEISVQRENILSIKTISEDFNSKLLAMYKNHLNLLNENTFIPAIDLDKLTESKLFDSVMQEIKGDAVEIAKRSQSIEYDFEKELELLRESGNFVYDTTISKNTDNINNNKAIETGDEKGYEYEGEDEDEDKDIKIAGNNYEREQPASAENDDDGDVKVFAKTAEAGYLNSDNAEADNLYQEKPRATYDSDDYEYENENENENADGSFKGNDYSDEVYGIDGDDESYGDDSDLSGQDDMYGEEPEEEETQGSKGFLGFFKGGKNKKNNKNRKKAKNPPRKYAESDDEDIDEDDEDNLDIFEDLDEDDE